MSAVRSGGTRAATAARVARSDFKRELKSGRVTLKQALDAPLAQRMFVCELVGSLPFRKIGTRSKRPVRVATNSAYRVCELAEVGSLQRIADLDFLERKRLVVAYAEFHKTGTP